MKRKVIIDLDGIIFESIRESFARVAWSEYGRVKAGAIIIAYNLGIGCRGLRDEISNVLNKCAMSARPYSGAIDALGEIVRMPGVTVEFCSQVAFTENAAALERYYRGIAPAMNDVAHYELISPFESKKDYLYKSTGAEKDGLNYVLDGPGGGKIKWPARWRTTPVLINTLDCDVHHVRSFPNLAMFKDFLKDQYHSR